MVLFTFMIPGNLFCYPRSVSVIFYCLKSSVLIQVSSYSLDQRPKGYVRWFKGMKNKISSGQVDKISRDFSTSMRLTYLSKHLSLILHTMFSLKSTTLICLDNNYYVTKISSYLVSKYV